MFGSGFTLLVLEKKRNRDRKVHRFTHFSFRISRKMFGGISQDIQPSPKLAACDFFSLGSFWVNWIPTGWIGSQKIPEGSWGKGIHPRIAQHYRDFKVGGTESNKSLCWNIYRYHMIFIQIDTISYHTLIWIILHQYYFVSTICYLSFTPPKK